MGLDVTLWKNNVKFKDPIDKNVTGDYRPLKGVKQDIIKTLYDKLRVALNKFVDAKNPDLLGDLQELAKNSC